MAKSKITFKRTKGATVITVPDDLLAFAAENNPEYPIKVLNQKDFAEKVAFELEHNLGDPETGITGFEALMDKAIQEVTEGGNDCVEDLN